MNSIAREISWSHSRLQAFETCPRRHHEVDILKNFVEGDNEKRDYGSDVHFALEMRCRHDKELEPEYAHFQPVADAVLALPGEKHFEERLAIDRNFQPCGYLDDPKTWLRVVVDVLIINGERAGALDYKTGKRKADFSQLQLNAAVVFAHYPHINSVTATYWWIGTKGRPTDTRTYERVDLPDIWTKFLPKVRNYQKACGTQDFPPRPSGLCKNYCPVTTCPFHGKGR